MTEWEIEKEATKRNNYLQKKGGWRGFIEGAIWMQNQVLPQADVIKSVCTCTTLPVPPQTINGKLICMNCNREMEQTVL